jgi:hypothetical protein
MKASVYEIAITTDFIHGWTKRIREIYIPELRISVNLEPFNVFRTENGRYKAGVKIRAINIPNSFARSLDEFLQMREILLESTKIIYKKL